METQDPAPVSTTALVEGLRARLLDVVAELGLGSRPWTVVDYPNHLNCGDAALYLGLENIAASVGAPVLRVLDRSSYRPQHLDPGSLIVLQAGGNWGGLYPTHHRLRVRLLGDSRGRDVLQLPQSIQYADEHHREELRRAVAEHGRTTLLVRDQRSYDIAVRDYDCPVFLAPDAAFALGTMERLAPRTPLRLQVRTDKEGNAPADLALDGEVFDWLTARRGSLSWTTWQAMMAVNRLQRLPLGAAARVATVRAAHDLARHSVLRARDLLSAGEVVVTDRLHGHILCTLLSIPHVVVDDKFGKISALRNTWTSMDRGHRFAADWTEVTAAVDDLRRSR
ncbi:polysaccharide pyruvyl transferase family protein [Kineococcus radiotolerans]|uniref:Polysaccharide pyruvyl transferase n=1 Tax=Kineococcus radiotolerans (strain ATCC BAA-149 / DSM 14245 / SRS30216) TaxID=266940 RepID=A6WEA7_KINRD|nr:polysaccharide pyruvyl transferase family protein [Kineococcus radiotolerans]ABS05146.1 polysaccharide pyruvyl transferase [Kineococcus radiotolerans SRS30216 = ATCC BAA-149]